MEYRRFFDTAIGKLKSERRYRVFADLERDASAYPSAKWHHDGRAGEVTIWCSNDYLGMGRHPQVIAAMRGTAAKVGVGAGGTRNMKQNSQTCTAKSARSSSPRAGFPILRRFRRSPICCRTASFCRTRSITIR
jgi:7-keto-8-aminopelargonate synthetase-like enzyme